MDTEGWARAQALVGKTVVVYLQAANHSKLRVICSVEEARFNRGKPEVNVSPLEGSGTCWVRKFEVMN